FGESVSISGNTVVVGAGIRAVYGVINNGPGAAYVFAAPPLGVTGVSSIDTGTYGVGAMIPITVTFNEPVTVTGTPQLTLNDGGVATYAGGSGTPTLTFDYTVGKGDYAADLDYASTSALTLNGGSIEDAAGN